MDLSIHNSPIGASSPRVSDQNRAGPAFQGADAAVSPQGQASKLPRPGVVIDARKVSRVSDEMDARDLQAETHNVFPSPQVQTFLQIASNGENRQSVDLYV